MAVQETAGEITGKNVIGKRESMQCTTIDVLTSRAVGLEGGATAMDHQDVNVRHATNAPVTVGTIIGVTEMRAQKLRISSAEDVHMDINGVDGVIVMDRLFAVN